MLNLKRVGRIVCVANGLVFALKRMDVHLGPRNNKTGTKNILFGKGLISKGEMDFN